MSEPSNQQKERKQNGFSTRAIRDGDPPDSETGAVIPPIYHATTYVMKEPGVPTGQHDYIRTGNPTRDALEEKIASLENGGFGLCYSSGISAIHCTLTLLDSGDRVLAEENVYGGTHRLLNTLSSKYDIPVQWIDTTDLDAVKDGLEEGADLLWLETPTNPLMKVVDLPACSDLARSHGTISVVDNTLASPYLQNPLDLGIDIVVHSATKYLGGHTDALGGAIVTNEDELYEKLQFFQNAIGAVPGTLENVTFLKGAKTLSLRMERACENTAEIARFLQNRPEVREVKYPGLSSHPQHELASEQMRDFGGIVSFELDANRAARNTFLEQLDYFELAVSLGAVESLINHPWSMTHAPVPEEEKRAQGITPELIRISTGIEDIDDLLSDLESALQSIS